MITSLKETEPKVNEIKFITNFDFAGQTVDCSYDYDYTQYFSNNIPELFANTIKDFFMIFANWTLIEREKELVKELTKLELEYNILNIKMPIYAWMDMTEKEYSLWKEKKEVPFEKKYEKDVK